MKAIYLTGYGNPAQNLQMVGVAEPKAPNVGEALVRMEYAPVDYSDLLLANGVYFLNPQLPSVIGGEGAGIVEAIGPGVGTSGTFSCFILINGNMNADFFQCFARARAIKSHSLN